jgi:predicted RNase H-like HicB family nuclease
MQLEVTIHIWQKGKWYVAHCPELDFVSQGPSSEEARHNLLEVIDIQFEEMRESGALEDYLYECGYAKENGVLVSQPEMVGFEKSAVQVA